MRTILLLLLSVNLSASIINVQLPVTGKDIYTNFQTAINSAKDGDTIMLPKCNLALSGITQLNKQLTIIGQGIKSTVIYRDESASDASVLGWKAMILMNKKCNIIGISFKSKRPSLIANDGFSTVQDIGIKVNYASGFKIKDCKFEYFGESAIDVRHRDTLANGLITNCEFNSNYKGEDGQGLGYGVVIYGEGKQWVVNPKFGTSNFIFIENCKFINHRHSVASAGGSLYVFRYNVVYNNIISAPYTHAVDTHDGRGPGNGTNTFGSRATEVYKNQIINQTFVNGNSISNNSDVAKVTESTIGICSGDAVVYENTISGYRFGVVVKTTYTNIPETVTLYYWGNIFTPYISKPIRNSTEFYNYNPTIFIVNKDYFAIKKLNYQPYKYPY